jgi:outer membrane receptor protein involved in Fe transport
MYNEFKSFGRLSTLALAVGACLTAAAGSVRAQDSEEEAQSSTDTTGVIEEVFAVGRFLSAAESLSAERLELPVSADFLGADVIARAADPDIASALRRVPGLTLVDGKFVYVRGLGERYSSVLVNGAAVPSPDLTRSVVPLDIFPTSIVESIKIQKSPSPDATAAFGGGMIDVRTISVPKDVVASFNFGFGTNTISDSDGLTSRAGGTPLPSAIATGIDTYLGDISVSNILSTLRTTNALASISDARAIHQGFLDSLNTDVGIRKTSLDPDVDAKVALGNSWDLGDKWTFGVLMNATYNEKWRNEDQHREGVGNPTENYVDIERTVYEERSIGALQVGLDYLTDHSLEFSSYVINHDEDQSSILRGFDANNLLIDLDQKVGYQTRLQQRELKINQISGSHTFQETPWFSKVLGKRGWEDLEFDWFYSESEATTDIPNETTFQASAIYDPVTGESLDTQVLATTTSGQFSFLNLEDQQDSWGGNLSLPLEFDKASLTVSGGWWGSQKSRDYYQYMVNLNTVGIGSTLLAGTPADVLVPANLTVANGFNLSLGSQFGTESYIAAQTVDAGFLMADVELAKWRFMVGARQETYKQAVLPINLLDYTGTSIRNLQNSLSDPNQRLAIKEDDTFASTALTYNGAGALGSDDYQIRISYGQTIVRPDLREVANVIYIDPELDIRVQGNPSLQSSPIDNFEIRGEFYYGSGDNFTVSLFHKDIESPIEQVRSAGSDDDVVLSFANAETGWISGVEFEGLKTLPKGFFVAGNLTLSDSEIQIDPGLSTILTNLRRRMTGHSEWVVNATLGYDSPSGMHSAYLNFNAFGDRIFFAGDGQNDDAYELPFDSLGVVYKYFPTDRMQVEFKIDNILDEQRQFEQKNSNGVAARILEQGVGRSLGLGVRWAF